MTDRECLLIAYGALIASRAPNAGIFEIIHAHIFRKEEIETTKTPLDCLEAKAHKVRTGDTLNIRVREMPEEKLATPGDYQLKRHILGPVGLKLSECDWKKLKAGIAKYRDAMALGPVHPEAVKDVEAAELYLKSSSEQESFGESK